MKVSLLVCALVVAVDLRLGIREKREGEAGFLPQPQIDLHRVNADRYHANAALAELTYLALKAP